MSSPDSRSSPNFRELLPALLVALAYFLVLMLTSTRYGYFRDALYYLACSEHLAWGYVDQPPLIAFLAWLVRHTIGTSLPALLLLPALAGAARILLTAQFAQRLGAGRFGCSLAAVLAATPGVWQVIDHQFAMNAFEALFWTGCAYCILRMIQTQNTKKHWLLFGLIAGLGLENKYSISAFAFCLFAAMLLTSARRFLFSGWLIAGGVTAFLIFLPNFLWSVQHHWPFLELMHNIRASGRDIALSPGQFLAQQVLIMQPLTLPFWLAGLGWYFFAKEARAYRIFGWTFVFTILFFLLAHGKNYYTAPAYPLVMSAGGVVVERFVNAAARSSALLSRLLKPAAIALPLAGAVLLLPVTLPVLSVDAYLRYQARLPFAVPRSEHSHMGSPLPQHFADEFGWLEMVEATARAYHSLSPEEQAKTAIFGNDYGQAGAIDFFGPRYGLPRAVSGHQSYFLWGPRNYTGEIIIVLGGEFVSTSSHFASCEVVPTDENPYALERRPVLLCRGLKQNLQTLWPQLKNWD
jgi:hypothetical protein